MSDGCTDAQRMCDSHKTVGGLVYCMKCGKYHPHLPFCPNIRIPKPTQINIALPKAKISVEVLYHFKCSDCKKWWSVGNWEPEETVCCPHCGEPHMTGQRDEEVFGNVDLKGWKEKYVC